MQHTLKPDSYGNILFDNKNGTVKPGDTIVITGNPLSVLFSNLQSSAVAPIVISNVANEKLVVGNPTWTGKEYPYAIMFKRCNYIKLVATEKGAFVINGATTTQVDRGAYFNCRIDDLSDNFTVRGLVINNGGNGIWCKTEVDPKNAATWSPNTLKNFVFEDLEINNTFTEGTYIGHTGTWWNISTNSPYYPSSTTDKTATNNPSIYKQPIKLENVIIRNCKLTGCGLDGIQTAAIDNLQVYNNEVYNWGTQKNPGHSGGILIGGRVKGYDVHDNYVHDGWGDLMQLLGEGGATAKVYNNLLANTALGNGIYIRGTNDQIVTITHNTVVGINDSSCSSIKINGFYGQTSAQVIQDNILAGSEHTNQWVPNETYIYQENGGKCVESNNAKYKTVEEAKLDAANFYQPLSGSPAFGLGYVKVIPEPPKPPVPTKTKLASTIVGGYTFDMFDDGTSESKKVQ